MTRSFTRALAVCLTLALTACEDDEAALDGGATERDAGAPLEDAGIDAARPDAGPPQTFVARLVDNVPGHPAVDVCMWTTVEGGIVPAGAPGTLLTPGEAVVPFRGVSPYLRDNPFFLAYDVVDFLVALYPAGELGEACPNDPNAEGAPDAVVIDEVLGASLEPDGTFTILATGFDEGTLGAAEGELPSRCGPTLDAPCDEATAAQVIVVPDDQAAPASGEAWLRVSNQIPNAPAGFNVCFDPDLVPDPEEAGVCAEPASSVEPTVLFADVAPTTVTDYRPLDPIQPTGDPAPGVGGGIYLVPETTGDTGCPPFSALPAPLQRCYPILAAFPPPGPPSESIRPNLAEGDVSTLFLSGAAGASEPYGSSMLLWKDR